MRNRFSRDDGQNVILTSFRDLQTAIIIMLVMIIVMLMLFVKPDMKKADTESDRQRGNIRVEITWPNEMDVDIDLWCQAPGDIPVGYSNKSGVVFNLVRDDLGSYMDLTGINYEVIFSRGAPPGEYICNIHWFGNAAKLKEVPVMFFVTYRPDDSTDSKSSPVKIIQNKATLFNQGEELTVARWKIDPAGVLVPGSINSVQHPLRDYKPPKRSAN